MDRFQKLSSNTALFAISSFSSKLLVFLLLPLYTSYLSQEEYGIVDLLTNLTTLLFPVLTLSLVEGVLRFSYETDQPQEAVLAIGLGAVAVGLGVLLAGSPVVLALGGTVGQYWWWLVAMFAGYSLCNTFSAILRGTGQVRWVAVQGVVQTALTVGGNLVLLVVLDLGLLGYLISLVGGYFLTAAVVFFGAGIYRQLGKLSFDRGLLRQMLAYSMPMIPGKAAWWANHSLDKYFIIGFGGLGPSGLYSVAHKIPSMLSVVLEIFNQAWQLSAMDAYSNRDQEAGFYSAVHQYYVSFTAACGAGLILLSQLLGKILFSAEFFEGWRFVPALVAASVFSSLTGYYHSVFRAAKMSRQLCWTVLTGTAANLMLNLLLVPALGAMGAAYGTMLAFLLEWAVSFRLCSRVIRLQVRPERLAALFVLLILQAVLMPLVFWAAAVVAGLIFLLTGPQLWQAGMGIWKKIRKGR